jgi:dTDP-4-dehydrorhamnose reductase
MNVSPRSEQSELWTTNIYGKSKLDGEKSITSENLNALILRTNFFGFSYRQHNSLLERIIDTIQLKHDFNGFTDVHFNPVSVLYLIRAIEHLNAIDAKGTFNIVSNSVITKFDFAIMVAQIFDLDENHVIPSISRGNKNFVDRPNYLALSPAKYLKTHPPRIPSLEEMLLELKEDTLWSDKLRS